MKEYKNIKPSFDANRVQLSDVLPLSTPFTVILDTSEVCNFKCNYCFRSEKNEAAWGYAISNEIMSKEIFETAVSQIQQFPEQVKQISLSHQGEPLANKAIPWMVKYIKKEGIKSRVSIHTNGSLLTEQYIEELADSEIDRVIFSLQGLSAEKYRKVCEYDLDFERFYNNLKYFYRIKRNTQICIKIIDAALDEGEEEKFYDLFSPIADRVFIEEQVPIWKEKKYLNSKSSDKIAFNKYGKGFPRQEVCPLIFHTIVVLPNGDVYPCTQLLQKEKLGNIKEQTLQTLWNSTKRKEMLIKQCRLCPPEVCTDCGIIQNTIFTRGDMLDESRMEILKRLEKQER